MMRGSGLIRWGATVVYAAAVLGALIVPHNHGLFPAGCCQGDPCVPAESADQKRACGHSHSTCGHTHSTPVQEQGETPSPTPHEHHDCQYCQFLAQPAQLAAAPVLATLQLVVAAVPTPVAASGCPFTLSVPPARGPPVA